MKIAWLTDIHLNFLRRHERQELYEKIEKTSAREIFVSGDISEAPEIAGHLREMANEVSKPIRFVLGNHDYYRSHVAAVRDEMRALTAEVPNLHWLMSEATIGLSEATCLVGVDGWGDGRCGEAMSTSIMFNDFLLIRDLVADDRAGLLDRLQALSAADSAFLAERLHTALATYDHCLVLTHIPPFPGACWYHGRLSPPNWQPWLVCGAVGDVLLQTAKEYPQKHITVFCGHTHGAGHYQPLPNLEVWTGKADYKVMQISGTFELHAHLLQPVGPFAQEATLQKRRIGEVWGA